MKQYIYADGVENVTLSGGMVRLDLFHFAGRPEKGQQELLRDVDQQLILPPAAFMRAFESMQRFVDELEKSGVIKRQATASSAELKGNEAVSPNFE